MSTLSPSMSTLLPIESSLSPSVTSLLPIESSLSPSESDLSPSESDLSPSESSLSPSESTLSPSESSLSPSESTLTRSDVDSATGKFCQLYGNKDKCNKISICYWNGEKCFETDTYYNDAKSLLTQCNSLDINKCSNNDLCENVNDKCIPTKTSISNIFNNEDCKIFVKDMINMYTMMSNGTYNDGDLNELLNDDPRSLELLNNNQSSIDKEFMEQSTLIDTNGCGKTLTEYTDSFFNKD